MKKEVGESISWEAESLRKRQVCRKFVKDSIMSYLEQVESWGLITNWRHSYFTMSLDYELMVLDSFKELLKKSKFSLRYRVRAQKFQANFLLN